MRSFCQTKGIEYRFLRAGSVSALTSVRGRHVEPVAVAVAVGVVVVGGRVGLEGARRLSAGRTGTISESCEPEGMRFSNVEDEVCERDGSYAGIVSSCEAGCLYEEEEEEEVDDGADCEDERRRSAL